MHFFPRVGFEFDVFVFGGGFEENILRKINIDQFQKFRTKKKMPQTNEIVNGDRFYWPHSKRNEWMIAMNLINIVILMFVSLQQINVIFTPFAKYQLNESMCILIIIGFVRLLFFQQKKEKFTWYFTHRVKCEHLSSEPQYFNEILLFCSLFHFPL